MQPLTQLLGGSALPFRHPDRRAVTPCYCKQQGRLAVTRDPACYSDFGVPKRLLVQAVSAVMEGDRLQISAALPESEHLRRELADFRVQTDPESGYETFSARSGEHDDIVLSLAMLSWFVLQPSNHATTHKVSI